MILFLTQPKLTLSNAGNFMPMYETTVKTPTGETRDRVFAPNAQEAKKLFEQRHGPRNVPYIPHMIPS